MTARRVLFTAWPFPGHLFPQIAIAHALRRRGHECAFYTGRAAARVVRAEGFVCHPFRHVDEDAIDRLMRERPADPWRLARLPRLGMLLRRWLLDTVPQQIQDLESIVTQWAPSAIATDPTLWAPILVLGEKHRVPVAICSFVPACMVPGADVPPFGPGLPRPRGGDWRGHLAVAALRQLNRLSSRVGRRQGNVIRAAHGLPPLQTSVTEHTGAMPLYLVPAAPEFDYDRRDLPASVRYVGPCLWNEPRTEAPTPWVADIASNIPCVHVTEGTVHVHEPFLMKAPVDGLAELPLTVIGTTGGRCSVEELGLRRIPSNVRLERWVSHTDLLPHVDVMVTTGGAGSVLAALAAGVPLVVVPTEWDKQEIAQRVVESGAGIRLAPQRCSSAQLRESVLTVLHDPAFRARARRLSEIFARLGGAERAADLIIALEDARQVAA